MVAMEMSYSSFILKWEIEPRQCLPSPPLSHLSPSLTLSGCRWESHQLLFFISKSSIDALLAPVRSFSIFLCSLGSSMAAQAAARACETRPKLGLPCSDLQITHSCVARLKETQFEHQYLVWVCSKGAPLAGASAAWRPEKLYLLAVTIIRVSPAE